MMRTVVMRTASVGRMGSRRGREVSEEAQESFRDPGAKTPSKATAAGGKANGMMVLLSTPIKEKA